MLLRDRLDLPRVLDRPHDLLPVPHDARVPQQPVDASVVPSRLGHVISEEWLATGALRPNVELDQFVVMPNHIHGIVWITNIEEDTTTSARPRAPAERRFGTLAPGSLSAVVNGFKGAVTRRARAALGIERVWQRGFYEHVIRNHRALAAIQQYIVDNPAAWAEDEENPANITARWRRR